MIKHIYPMVFVMTSINLRIYNKKIMGRLVLDRLGIVIFLFERFAINLGPRINLITFLKFLTNLLNFYTS